MRRYWHTRRRVLGQCRDERWRFGPLGIGAELVAIIPLAAAFPGCLFGKRSSARPASSHDIMHLGLHNPGRTANAPGMASVPRGPAAPSGALRKTGKTGDWRLGVALSRVSNRRGGKSRLRPHHHRQQLRQADGWRPGCPATTSVDHYPISRRQLRPRDQAGHGTRIRNGPRRARP